MFIKPEKIGMAKPDKLDKATKLLRKAEKANSWKSLEKKADEIFSRLVRLRDSDQFGFVRCITCGKIKPANQVDCGHFISRAKYPTRWEMKNAHGQCTSCNLFQSGKQYEHSIAIDQKYGQGTAQKLLIQSRNIFKKDPQILKIIILDLETRYKELLEKRK